MPYGTEAELEAYALSTGQSLPSADLPAALVRATSYIDGKYGSRFSGKRAGGFEQDLAWPRIGAFLEGFPIPPDAIPKAVVNATYEAAIREARNPGSLSPDYVALQAIKREKVDVIETEYAVSATPSAADAQPVITVIDDMLAGLLKSAPIPGILVV